MEFPTIELGSGIIDFARNNITFYLRATMYETKPEYKKLLVLEILPNIQNENPVASLVLREVNKVYGFSCKAWVKKDYQNLGLYTVLSQARDHFAKEFGFNTILTSVHGNNVSHIKRLRRQGFKTQMISSNTSGERILLMAKVE